MKDSQNLKIIADLSIVITVSSSSYDFWGAVAETTPSDGIHGVYNSFMRLHTEWDFLSFKVHYFQFALKINYWILFLRQNHRRLIRFYYWLRKNSILFL